MHPRLVTHILIIGGTSILLNGALLQVKGSFTVDVETHTLIPKIRITGGYCQGTYTAGISSTPTRIDLVANRSDWNLGAKNPTALH